YPYKVTLGQEIYNLEHGATDLLMFNTSGRCRFRHYHQLQEHTLRNLGYNFTMHAISVTNFIPVLTKLTGAPPFRLTKAMLGALSRIREIDRQTYDNNNNSSIKVGIVGEIYTMLEPDINFDIVRKLQRMGAAVDVSLTLSHWLKKELKLDFLEKREEKREAKRLLSEPIGGHGFASVYNSLYYARHSFDGIIHLLPLSCMPESTTECLINYVAEKYGVPLYRFALDESNFEQGFITRLSTFVSMLKRKKKSVVLSGN
ncbi:unnamed protein product, partial [marine sediment metagenome]